MLQSYNIDSANCLLFLQEPATKELNFRFTKKTTDYWLEDELKYALLTRCQSPSATEADIVETSLDKKYERHPLRCFSSNRLCCGNR